MKFQTNMNVTKGNETVKALCATKHNNYVKWEASLAKVTLGELWKKLGIVEGESTNGHPQLTLGKNDGSAAVMYAKNPIAALNALADFYKYNNEFVQLDWGRHETIHDGNIDCDDVLVVFDRNNDNNRYTFFNWRNACYQPSVLNRSDLRSQRLIDKRSNMVQKHAELDRIMQARNVEPKSPYAVILWDDKSLTHYLENIKPYMEGSYLDFIAARNERWNLAKVTRNTLRPNMNYKPGFEPSPEHLAVISEINDLVEAGEFFALGIRVSGATKDRVCDIDPTNEKQVAGVIYGIQIAPKSTVYSILPVAQQ